MVVTTAGAGGGGRGCCAGSTTVSCTVTVTCFVPGRGRVPAVDGGGTGDIDAARLVTKKNSHSKYYVRGSKLEEE